MEEAEKMAALKKAYADIILNTAKEAAARIMVSERKAVRFQRELFAAKEEALNTLLRLKDMMDSKIAEMEIASLGQTRKIEELEAQLHEAEDMVTDLRAQLRALQDELEKVKSDLVQPPKELVIKESAVFHADISQDTKLNTSESILFCPPDSEDQFPSTSDTNDSPLNQATIDVSRCSTLGNAISQTAGMGGFPSENFCPGNSDLASLIMRSKETELYRNGCTQRIRAFERNLLNAKLPLPDETNDQYLNMKNESTIREDETGDPVCTAVSPMDGIMGSEVEKAIRLEELSQQDTNCGKNRNVAFFRRSCRRRRARYRNPKATSDTDLDMQSCEPSTLSKCKSQPCLENSIEESGEDLSRTIKQEAQKTLDSFLVPTSSLDANDVDPQLGCMDATRSNPEVTKGAIGQDPVDADEETINKLELSRQDNEVADPSGVSGCKLILEAVGVSFPSSDVKDEKTCETMNKAPVTQAVSDRLLKYTFRRKRKKEPLSCPEEDKPLEKKNNVKKRSGEKPSGAELQKNSSLIVESSRDSRRLFQVARQLISLSEKRW